MSDSLLTIVVVPRERFSHSERSLGSIYEITIEPFQLIDVSAGAPARAPLDVLRQLPGFLQEADDRELNVLIRPLDRGRPDEPVLLRLDDVRPDELHRIKQRAFMTLETASDGYQCWAAMDRRHCHSVMGEVARTLSGSTGYVRVAGSKAVAPQFRHADGRYPRVRWVEGVAGLLATESQWQGWDRKNLYV